MVPQLILMLYWIYLQAVALSKALNVNKANAFAVWIISSAALFIIGLTALFTIIVVLATFK